MTGSSKPALKLLLISAAVILPAAIYLYLPGIEIPASLPEASDSSRAGPAATHNLQPPSFDAVTSDESGMLFAAGKGPAGATILLQNGAKTLAETKADANGEWLLAMEQALEPGAYDLSLLAQSTNAPALPGKNKFALTIAPRRSAASTAPKPVRVTETAASQSLPQPAATPIATVKRGDSLWAIAHRHLGKGQRYDEIVSANKPQIKNPNLIYPRQQLTLPR